MKHYKVFGLSLKGQVLKLEAYWYKSSKMSYFRARTALFFDLLQMDQGQDHFFLVLEHARHLICVPSNFMTNRRVPKFSLTNCAQSSKKTFMCPKFCTNLVLKYTKCRISTNSSNFLKLGTFTTVYHQKLFAIATTNCRFAEKNRLRGNTASHGN